LLTLPASLRRVRASNGFCRVWLIVGRQFRASPVVGDPAPRTCHRPLPPPRPLAAGGSGRAIAKPRDQWEEVCVMAVSVRSQVSHPLDPLGPEEIAAAGKIVREQRGLTDSARIVSITLHEPSKDVVQSFKPGDPIDREAFIVVLDKAERATYEAVVSITAGEVRSWKHVPDVQPPIIFDEFLACESVVKQHPDFQEAMRK